jgi:hypothetical protein
MPKKNLLLIAAALALATVYVIYFTDWFRPKTVQIFHIYREAGSRPARGNALPELRFSYNHVLRLTEIKVVACAALATNKNPLPLWHLITESNSAPMKWFFYGQNIGGLHPAIKGTHPLPLETNVAYRLLLTAGKITGQHDFELK